MLADAEVDVAVHPPIHSPFDPFADGKLVTRRTGSVVEIVQADPHVLLDCGFLWDINANAALFAPWCQLRPPVPKLGLVGNFRLSAGFHLLGLNVPTNRPTQDNTRPMCQHWTMRLTVGSRIIAYQIGAFRPSINAMEASWPD